MELNYLISEAKSKNRVLVLVEGINDPKIYMELLRQRYGENQKKFEVLHVGVVDDICTTECGGCSKVKEVVKFIHERKPEWIDNMACIVDGDAKVYRNSVEVKEEEKYNDYLFRLKYYSIESYMYSKQSIKRILSKYSYLHEESIDTELIDILHERIEEQGKKLCFKIGLACLVRNDYSHKDIKMKNIDFKYSMSKEEFKALQQIENFLDYFIEMNKDLIYKITDKYKLDNNFNKSLCNIKTIINGKHYIKIMALIINNQLKDINKKDCCKNEMFKFNCSKKLHCRGGACYYHDNSSGRRFQNEYLDQILRDLENNIDINTEGINELLKFFNQKEINNINLNSIVEKYC